MVGLLNDFKGAAKRLDDVDIPRIGSEIGVGEDELHAFMDAETSGSGFDSQGRPKMLFEPHVFYRNLKGSKRDQAVKEGLAYPTQGEAPYPRDSYPRLLKAMAIDTTAAMKSASWGLGQILGENHVAAGYATVQDMIRAFMDDEEVHLDAVVKFLVANKIDDDLRALAALTRSTTPDDCRPIARVYNGSGYAKGQYHVKLARAHNKWRKIPDTPWPTPVVADSQTPAQAPENIVLKAQQRLRDLGYFEVGNVDGRMGARTKAAISSFQGDNGLPLTGELGSSTLAKLMDVRTPKRPISLERATATKDDIKGKSPTVKTGDWLQKIGSGILVAFGLGGVTDGTVNLDTLTSGIGKAKGLLDVVLQFSPWIIGIGVGALVLYFGSRIVREQVQAYREGRNV